MRNLIFCFMLMSSLMYAKDQNVVAVIGAGPAGLSAANTCQELGFQTVVFEQKRDVSLTDSVSFWPGLVSPKWDAIIKNLRDAFTKAGGTIFDKEVSEISQDADNFIVTTPKEVFSVKALVIATGKKPRASSFLFQKSDRILTNFWNGKVFSAKDSVIIIGQGQPLFHACLKAARTAGHVFVFPYRTNEVSLDPLIKIFPSVSITKGASITDLGPAKGKVFVAYFQEGSKLYKDASYLIVAEEKDPSSYLVENLCSLDSSQAIITSNDTGATSRPGLYACGEVTRKDAMTGVQAAADGQKTGLAIAYFLVNKGIAPQKATPPAQQRPEPVSPQPATGPSEPL